MGAGRHPCECIRMFVIFRTFANFSLRTSTFRRNTKYSHSATHPYAQYYCGWLCSSETAVRIPPPASFFFIRICTQADVYTLLHLFVLLHGARTTAQTSIATVHRACLPSASYSTTALSSSSSGHTLGV